MDREAALSKHILLTIIAAVVVIGIIILFLFIIQPSQEGTPHFNATVESSGKTMYIYHDGGDPVSKGTIIIRINGEEVPQSAISFLHAQDWPWSAGKTLKVDYSGNDLPRNVQIIAVKGSSRTLVFSTTLEQPVTPVPTTEIPAVTSPVPVTTSQIAQPTVSVTIGTGTAVMTPIVTVPTGNPPVPEPPIAQFSGTPRSGEAPLNVQFTDISSGNPTSWLWNFGDGGISDLQNPLHLYAGPGTYTISLTVSNAYGSQKKTEEQYITTAAIPVTNFTAIPAAGDAPLAVQFTDLSTGSPTAWQWNFGDGATSTLRNPSHTYSSPGTYSVSLTASNALGSNTRIQSGAITVSAAPLVDIYLTNSRQGNILPDGYLQFRVVSDAGWIKVGGQRRYVIAGDVVHLFPVPSDRAQIEASNGRFSALQFDSVRMYVNNEKRAEGIVSDISIDRFDSFRSTLILAIPAGDTGGSLQINGAPVAKGDHSFTVYDLKPGSSGMMYYTRVFENLNYDGGGDGYTFQ